jgi:3-oxoacyl-[acyl-carrier-protein] synthase-3
MAKIDNHIAHLYQEGKGLEVEQCLSKGLVGYMHMNGARVYLEAPRAMAECVDVLCRQAQLSPDELAHIIPHQANSRITRRVGELLFHDYGWPDTIMAQLADHVRTYGNLANASIGMALIETLRSGSLLPGQWIALPAVGGGMHYGCWLLRYQGIKNIDHTMMA